MKKLKTIIFCSLLVLLTACREDIEAPLGVDMTLVGSAVNFVPYVDNFNVTRATPPTPTGNSNNHEGGFNANDMMYIYRQYWDAEKSKWVYRNPPGTIYKYTDLNLGASGVFDKTSWRVYEGKTFTFYDPDYTNPESNLYDASLSTGQEHSYKKQLTKGDSIIWERGTTVRFRAWALSRMGNNLADGSTPGVPQSINYPDYMVCDWVTVSGPTQAIPLAMRHLGCRLGFTPRDNNQFVKIEISTDPADYMREDNADTDANDALDKHPAATDLANPEVNSAEWCAAQVADAFDRMCWPAGVDMETLSLLTCSPDGQTKYSYKSQEMTAEFIKEKNDDGTYKNVKHAQFFSSSDSRYYMVSIPYDMHTREPIILPPYTRFRVWLRDVNNGDAGTSENANYSTSENRYHIFQLSDVKKIGTSELAFPNGFTMLAGYSATFSVGYHYGHTLEIWAEDSFSWDECPLEATTSEDQHIPTDEPTASNYYWWTSAINTACEDAKAGRAYKPDFKISNQNQLLEFAKLVNGDFTTDPIYKKVTITRETGSRFETHTVNWYTGIGQNGDGSPDTLWISREDLIDQGYVLYSKYTPSIADRPATIEEDYLQAPFNFYDDQLKSRWTVTLDADIDLRDWQLPTIGSQQANPFCGYFDGAGHTLSNLYMDTHGQIFGYAMNGTIANLKVVSTHPVSITGTCENERILGCSVIAPSTTATLANQTKGYCYFVGCIHQGTSSAPLVNDSQDLGFEMYGCMQANDGIASGNAALANLTTSETIVGIISEETELEEIKWGKVSCNYYDTELSPGAVAFHTPSGNLSGFHRLQYIRGAKTHILCAKNDFLVDSKTDWKKLTKERKDELYGVAPWRAMNWGIYMYNTTVREDINRCKMHYEPATTVGYAHLYPELKTGVPIASQYLNVLDQFN